MKLKVCKSSFCSSFYFTNFNIYIVYRTYSTSRTIKRRMLNTMFMIGILKQMNGMFWKKTKQIYYFQMINSTNMKNKFGIKTKIKFIKKKLKKNINPRKNYSLLCFLNVLKLNFTYSFSKNHLLKKYQSIILLYLVLGI